MEKNVQGPISEGVGVLDNIRSSVRVVGLALLATVAAGCASLSSGTGSNPFQVGDTGYFADTTRNASLLRLAAYNKYDLAKLDRDWDMVIDEGEFGTIHDHPELENRMYGDRSASGRIAEYAPPPRID
ncbi:MAG: hypothetical protein QF824_01965 [Candidatus Woesearchaeota archaeon]|jgi:hypothetical protein|nr:hypothetical protein [Candidatus Woesearchaeota archaeon]